MKMLRGGGSGSGSNKISDDVRRSRESGLSAKGNSQINARYSTIDMPKQSPNQVAPRMQRDKTNIGDVTNLDDGDSPNLFDDSALD